LVKVQGGFRFFPFDLGRIIWCKPSYTDTGKMLDPVSHGLSWQKDSSGRYQPVPHISPIVNIADCWTLRAGPIRLNPKQKDFYTENYADYQPQEYQNELIYSSPIGPTTIDITPNLIQSLLDNGCKAFFTAKLIFYSNAIFARENPTTI